MTYVWASQISDWGVICVGGWMKEGMGNDWIRRCQIFSYDFTKAALPYFDFLIFSDNLRCQIGDSLLGIVGLVPSLSTPHNQR